MKRIIGVHFWDKKVHLCWLNGDEILGASFNLPEDYRRDDILRQDFALQGVFRAIRDYLSQKVNISEFGMAIAVPDDFGIEETQRVYAAGRESGVEVTTTICETFAMALSVYGEYSFDGRMLAAVVSDNRVSIAEYDYSDEGVKKIGPHACGPWKGSDLSRAPFLHDYSAKYFDATDAEFFFISGSMNAGMSFEQAVRTYVNDSDMFGEDMCIKLLDSSYVVDGLGYLAGKLEGNEAFVGLGIRDTVSPYEILLGINGEIFKMIKPEGHLTRSSGLDMRRIPESGGDTESFIVYEKKGRRLIKIGAVNAPKEDIQDYFKKPVWVGINVDKNKDLSVVIQNLETQAYVEIPVEDAAEVEKAKSESEDTAAFVEKIIPILDNLEYATKFAQDQDNPYTKGIIQTYENARKILEENGVKIISGEGEPFDFNTQNAVAHVTDVDLPENTVKQVMQTGYSYRGKILRTASVIVAN